MPHIIVDSEGCISMIYDDSMLPLLQEGAVAIRRVSHVEPTDKNNWCADLGPINGPVLGPFDTRKQALDAEVEWLNQNIL